MEKKLKSSLVSESVRMRQQLTESGFGINELMRIYLATPVSDYFVQDASMGGYVPHKRRLQKRNFLI